MSTVQHEIVPSLVGGEWRTIDSVRSGEVFNPSTGAVLALTPAGLQAAAAEAATRGTKRRR